jgi:hypothetical protein
LLQFTQYGLDTSMTIYLQSLFDRVLRHYYAFKRSMNVAIVTQSSWPQIVLFAAWPILGCHFLFDVGAFINRSLLFRFFIGNYWSNSIFDFGLMFVIILIGLMLIINFDRARLRHRHCVQRYFLVRLIFIFDIVIVFDICVIYSCDDVIAVSGEVSMIVINAVVFFLIFVGVVVTRLSSLKSSMIVPLQSANERSLEALPHHAKV